MRKLRILRRSFSPDAPPKREGGISVYLEHRAQQQQQTHQIGHFSSDYRKHLVKIFPLNSDVSPTSTFKNATQPF